MVDDKPVIAFGEIVWDIFPDKTVLGGAPLNVAYHLHAQQRRTGIISRVGADQLGRETLTSIAELGVPVDAIQVDAELPTGQVYVTFNAAHEPRYEIVKPAAWDNVQLDALPGNLAENSYHLIFGTLAQRSAETRRTLDRVIAKADKKFYDVNLRPPFTTPDLVEASLAQADVVKVNREELQQLNGWFLHADGSDLNIGRKLLGKFAVDVLAITNADKGAALISADGHVEHPGFPVTQADPVGSGDAFFSALIHNYLQGLSLSTCLTAANRLGSWVASQPGATPKYP